MEAWELEGLKSPHWEAGQVHHLQSLHLRPLLSLLLCKTVLSSLLLKEPFSSTSLLFLLPLPPPLPPFLGRVLLFSSGCPGTYCVVDQADLEPTELHRLLPHPHTSAGIKGVL